MHRFGTPRMFFTRSGYAASGVLWPLLSAFRKAIAGMLDGAVPCPCPLRTSSILTGPNAFLTGFALPSRASSRVSGLRKSLAESPGDHRRRPICSTFLRRLSWDFAKIVFRELRLESRAFTDAVENYRGSGSPCDLLHTRHPNSRTGACGRSSQSPRPGT
jgi:hypothetical protein